MWWWLATPITLARAPIDPADKVQCVSYAPFRGEQTPLEPWTHIEADQIEQDLRQLKEITDCVRTYSMENGLDQVPAIAAKVGIPPGLVHYHFPTMDDVFLNITGKEIRE